MTPAVRLYYAAWRGFYHCLSLNIKLEFVFALVRQTFHDSLYQPNDLSRLRRATFQRRKVAKVLRNPWFRTSFCSTGC